MAVPTAPVPPTLHPRLRRRTALSLVVGASLAILVGLPAVVAADPFVAGQPAARPMTAPDGGTAAVKESRRLLAALGLPAPATAAAQRLADRLESATFDDVTFRDGGGRPVLLVRLRSDGSLRHLARLEAPDPTVAQLPEARVPGRAAAVARAAGLRADGVPNVTADASSAWAVSWPRTEAGVPVLGDGTWVRLDRDGTVRSLASTVSELAARPATTIAEAEARTIAEHELDRLLDPSVRADVRVAGARLAWVAPNDTFEPARPDAPEPVRRLAWVVGVTAGASAGDRFGGLELDLDAGSGRLLGGDVLE